MVSSYKIIKNPKLHGSLHEISSDKPSTDCQAEVVRPKVCTSELQPVAASLAVHDSWSPGAAGGTTGAVPDSDMSCGSAGGVQDSGAISAFCVKWAKDE